MRNLFSTKVKIILVIAALLTAALAIYSGISNQSLPSVIVQGVLAPFRTAGTTLTNTAEKYYSYMFRYEALDAENKVLEERIAKMEDVARQADSVSRENERLRRLLELKATNEDYKLVDAYIIGWSSSDWESTFTINRGTNAGIRENLCAITANGEVVGLVTEVGVNYAVVKTVLDSTLEISGTISTSGYNGMVKGGYVSGNDTLLQMNYLPSESIIRNKDQVVTSGSTVYPRGLIIGSVVDAGYEETGVAKFALLDPAADINSLEQVFIITQYTTEVMVTPGTAPDSETAPAPSETPPSETAAAPPRRLRTRHGKKKAVKAIGIQARPPAMEPLPAVPSDPAAKAADPEMDAVRADGNSAPDHSGRHHEPGQHFRRNHRFTGRVHSAAHGHRGRGCGEPVCPVCVHNLLFFRLRAGALLRWPSVRRRHCRHAAAAGLSQAHQSVHCHLHRHCADDL